MNDARDSEPVPANAPGERAGDVIDRYGRTYGVALLFAGFPPRTADGRIQRLRSQRTDSVTVDPVLVHHPGEDGEPTSHARQAHARFG